MSTSQSNLLDLQFIVLGPDVIHIGDRVVLVLDEHCRFVDQLHAIDVQSFAQLIVRISALGLLWIFPRFCRHGVPCITVLRRARFVVNGR